ncbi:hypothetical protein VNO77_21653 [Canavalia gladiata]|uniref:Uncharacterized protein n=1 Tax=Canavalia gladiata TaxID=3824 RepID=A0AAN9LRI7_CANGL
MEEGGCKCHWFGFLWVSLTCAWSKVKRGVARLVNEVMALTTKDEGLDMQLLEGNTTQRFCHVSREKEVGLKHERKKLQVRDTCVTKNSVIDGTEKSWTWTTPLTQ